MQADISTFHKEVGSSGTQHVCVSKTGCDVCGVKNQIFRNENVIFLIKHLNSCISFLKGPSPRKLQAGFNMCNTGT